MTEESMLNALAVRPLRPSSCCSNDQGPAVLWDILELRKPGTSLGLLCIDKETRSNCFPAGQRPHFHCPVSNSNVQKTIQSQRARDAHSPRYVVKDNHVCQQGWLGELSVLQPEEQVRLPSKKVT